MAEGYLDIHDPITYLVQVRTQIEPFCSHHWYLADESVSIAAQTKTLILGAIVHACTQDVIPVFLKPAADAFHVILQPYNIGKIPAAIWLALLPPTELVQWVIWAANEFGLLESIIVYFTQDAQYQPYMYKAGNRGIKAYMLSYPETWLWP